MPLKKKWWKYEYIYPFISDFNILFDFTIGSNTFSAVSTLTTCWLLNNDDPVEINDIKGKDLKLLSKWVQIIWKFNKDIFGYIYLLNP